MSSSVDAERSAANLRLRVLSAIVLVPLALAAIFLGGPLYTIIVAAGAAIVTAEWFDVVDLPERLGRRAAVAIGLTSVAGFAFGGIAGLFGVLAIALVFGALAPTGRRAWAIAACTCIGLAGVSLVWLREGAGHGVFVTLFLFLTVWAVDIAGFFVGRGLEGPKLAPRISPSKTWAGFVGAIVAASLVGALTSAALGSGSPLAFAGLAAALAIAATMGDLAESALKRHFDKKNSGRLIPGHGGLFDRVDGLICACLVLAVVCLVTGSNGLD